MQSPFPLGFNDYIYLEGNISRMPVYLLECKKNVKVDLMVIEKMATLSTKFVLKTHKYFSIAFNNHGRHGLLSFLNSLPISFYVL